MTELIATHRRRSVRFSRGAMASALWCLRKEGDESGRAIGFSTTGSAPAVAAGALPGMKSRAASGSEPESRALVGPSGRCMPGRVQQCAVGARGGSRHERSHDDVAAMRRLDVLRSGLAEVASQRPGSVHTGAVVQETRCRPGRYDCGSGRGRGGHSHTAPPSSAVRCVGLEEQPAPDAGSHWEV